MLSTIRFLQRTQKAVGAVGEEAGTFFGSNLFETPIGVYLLVTWGSMVLVFACSFAALEETCTVPIVAGAIDLVFALVHAAFAYYLHRTIVIKLGAETDPSKIKQWIVTEGYKNRVILVYLVLFFASLVFNSVMVAFVHCADTRLEWASWAATILMILYHIAAVVFALVCELLEPIRQWGKHKTATTSGIPAQVLGAEATSIAAGTTGIARKAGDIFESREQPATKIGELVPAQLVVAAGPPFDYKGKIFVPIRPRGVVELAAIHVQQKQPRKGAAPPASAAGAAGPPLAME